MAGGDPETLGRRLVNLSDGFHAESGRTRSRDPLVKWAYGRQLSEIDRRD